MIDSMAARRLLGTLGLLALPPAGFGYAFETLVRRNLFRTGPHADVMPDATGVPYEHAHFWTSDGEQLEGWLFDGGDLPATVLFMHGTNYNSSDMWATDERAGLFGGFLRGLGCRFFVFDYRGYGRSDGIASEQSTYLDAQGALAYLRGRPKVTAPHLVFYGFSMGTGVAVELAARERCAGLVLRAPFSSIRDLVFERVPRLRRVLRLMPWLPLTRFDSAAKISSIHVPLMIMHGDADTTVPPWMGHRLFELANEPKTFVPFPGAEHQDFPLDIMVPAVRGFVERVAGVEPLVPQQT
jgi:hypothetical protein